MRPNYVIGVEHGFVKVEFKNGDSYIANVPKGKITGITFGDRSLVWCDSVWMVDLKNALIAQIYFDSDRGFFSSN